eukprot:TRINITY_DN4810_c0_g1_i2.p1 TRINITY_DN4810_c0_g1~~TRINITY_DN4810_c0_g1_i2.p1  ORF type:complete len:1113 (-),score=267.58 TRINITY_DN4810_c0_g1_i2:130-3087(-)
MILKRKSAPASLTLSPDKGDKEDSSSLRSRGGSIFTRGAATKPDIAISSPTKPGIEGWIQTKIAGKLLLAKRRWIKIQDHELLIFQASTDEKPVETIDLRHSHINGPVDPPDNKTFELHSAGDDRVTSLVAETTQDADLWLQGWTTAIDNARVLLQATLGLKDNQRERQGYMLVRKKVGEEQEVALQIRASLTKSSSFRDGALMWVMLRGSTLYFVDHAQRGEHVAQGRYLDSIELHTALVDFFMPAAPASASRASVHKGMGNSRTLLVHSSNGTYALRTQTSGEALRWLAALRHVARLAEGGEFKSQFEGRMTEILEPEKLLKKPQSAQKYIKQGKEAYFAIQEGVLITFTDSKKSKITNKVDLTGASVAIFQENVECIVIKKKGFLMVTACMNATVAAEWEKKLRLATKFKKVLRPVAIREGYVFKEDLETLRWCILSKGILSFYRRHTEIEEPLEHFDLTAHTKGSKVSCSAVISDDALDFTFNFSLPEGPTIKFICATEAERNSWVADVCVEVERASNVRTAPAPPSTLRGLPAELAKGGDKNASSRRRQIPNFEISTGPAPPLSAMATSFSTSLAKFSAMTGGATHGMASPPSSVHSVGGAFSPPKTARGTLRMKSVVISESQHTRTLAARGRVRSHNDLSLLLLSQPPAKKVERCRSMSGLPRSSLAGMSAEFTKKIERVEGISDPTFALAKSAEKCFDALSHLVEPQDVPPLWKQTKTGRHTLGHMRDTEDDDDHEGEDAEHSPSLKHSDLPAVVLDCGSSLVRAGFAGDVAPKFIFPTSLAYVQEKENAGKGIYGIGKDNPLNPASRVIDWKGLAEIWEYTLTQKLEVDPTHTKVCITEPNGMTPKARHEMIEIFFEQFGVPFLSIQHQGALSLLASGKDTGVVVSWGNRLHVTPIANGLIIKHACETVPFGGADLTNMLARIVQDEHNVNTKTREAMHDMRLMKEKLCYNAIDLNAEVMGVGENRKKIRNGLHSHG